MNRQEVEERIASLQDEINRLTATLDAPKDTDTVAYPDVVVPLVGEDGNAFAILGRVTRALQDAGVDEVQRKVYYDMATSGDYDHLLRVTMQWVTTC